MRPIQQLKKEHLGNESGFTLLEIIAVLVILSILAVVALPRYFNLQEQARDKAMQTALAEGIGRINGYFAQQVLAGSLPTQIDYTDANLGSDLGDFQFNVTNGLHTDTGPMTLTITGLAPAVQGLTTITTMRRPGV